jgi:hypothetical protein
MTAQIDWVAVGTLAVAAATGALAFATFRLAATTSKLAASASEEAATSKAALSATIRPALVDLPLEEPGAVSTVKWADGSTDQVGPGTIRVHSKDDYVLCTLPLRNIGPGAAVIVGLGLVEAGFPGNASRMIVPSGESTRFSFSIPKDRPELQEGIHRILDGNFALEVAYTDIDGQQTTLTRAFVHQLDPQLSYRVRQVALLHYGDAEPFAMSGPADG